MSITWLINAFTLVPAATAINAVRIGISIAVTDPNSTSSTSTAIASPTAVARPGPDDSVCSIAGPPSSTWTVGVRAAWAVRITSSIAAAGRSLAGASKVTVANAVVASGETAGPPESYGSATAIT